MDFSGFSLSEIRPPRSTGCPEGWSVHVLRFAKASYPVFLPSKIIPISPHFRPGYIFKNVPSYIIVCVRSTSVIFRCDV
ncbi:hypothetical protein ANANG_G00018060 [Anguilla anguilla]|uniref:Uncharacterized protein n=1 Tax=Anguilla anguilla TaxID=7936 RepID=A0A9D3SAD2_ANGAN|nr:hypothetical protein ANANG_G00018060 [Anguilla anguilla]